MKLEDALSALLVKHTADMASAKATSRKLTQVAALVQDQDAVQPERLAPSHGPSPSFSSRDDLTHGTRWKSQLPVPAQTPRPPTPSTVYFVDRWRVSVLVHFCLQGPQNGCAPGFMGRAAEPFEGHVTRLRPGIALSYI